MNARGPFTPVVALAFVAVIVVATIVLGAIADWWSRR